MVSSLNFQLYYSASLLCHRVSQLGLYILRKARVLRVSYSAPSSKWSLMKKSFRPSLLYRNGLQQPCPRKQRNNQGFTHRTTMKQTGVCLLKQFNQSCLRYQKLLPLRQGQIYPHTVQFLKTFHQRVARKNFLRLKTWMDFPVWVKICQQYHWSLPSPFRKLLQPHPELIFSLLCLKWRNIWIPLKQGITLMEITPRVYRIYKVENSSIKQLIFQTKILFWDMITIVAPLSAEADCLQKDRFR